MIDRFEPTGPHDRRLSAVATGVLRDLNQAGMLSAADTQIAGRVSALVGETDESTTVALALAVRAVRLGSVCVDLSDVDLSDRPPLVESVETGTASLVEPVETRPAPLVEPVETRPARLVEPVETGPAPLVEPVETQTQSENDAARPLWRAPDRWAARVAASTTAAAGVIRVEGQLIYLDRYWREEQLIRDVVIDRAAEPPPVIDDDLLEAGAIRVFPTGFEEQRAAAVAAVRGRTTVLTGGPGTGKTTAVAGLLALLAEQSQQPLRIALTAPTGKAAARLAEAVDEATARLTPEDRARLPELPAVTLHRLLGSRPDTRTRFRHHRDNRLAHDVIVVDETSMVSLSMMARLLESVRADTRLILVGDPDQLSSVEAGAVLADLVAGLAAGGAAGPGASVVSLRTTHRFGVGIGRLAAAVRAGDPDEVWSLLSGEGGVSTSSTGRVSGSTGGVSGSTGGVAGSTGAELQWLDPADPATLDVLQGVALRSATTLREAAERGDREGALTALDSHRLLCAHREGPFGARQWNRQVERWLAEATGLHLGAARGREWYVGRPVLVTANDYGLGLYNGDTGVVLRDDSASSGMRVAIAGGEKPLEFATSRLSDVDTMHALTIHKSQGSQAQEVTVLLPEEDSPLLTRELLYTAVTRAQRTVRIVGSPEAIRAAVERPARRASGLRDRLASGASSQRAEGETRQ